MEALIIDNPEEANNRLNELGLSEKDLIDIAMAMVGAKRDTTKNDVAGAGGLRSWMDGTRRAREILTMQGWKRDRTAQVESVANKQLGIRLIVCNTDASTGLPNSIPQNSSKKGTGTQSNVNCNQQNFFSQLGFENQASAGSEFVTWYLCVYGGKETMRAELSCPTVMANGYFVEFRERIILSGENDDFNGTKTGRKPVAPTSTPVQEYDISVVRKTGTE
ncbi:hypothetical protein [Pelagicoccus sp. SDUM812002]|uniref:hypothetical protein n=1 Tax=Pelagicoccus sp. SDUM812002 TaxID=3041266 RepID=UPI00280C6559|nr:hypothetical protein [Pelagicoccus sp. SDUM812002]MDQ8184256.1 hypothetical protein [Pelagicoccus sp. SDUM812002]